MSDPFKIVGSDDESSTKSLPEESKKNDLSEEKNISPEKVVEDGMFAKEEKVEMR